MCALQQVPSMYRPCYILNAQRLTCSKILTRLTHPTPAPTHRRPKHMEPVGLPAPRHGRIVADGRPEQVPTGTDIFPCECPVPIQQIRGIKTTILGAMAAKVALGAIVCCYGLASRDGTYITEC